METINLHANINLDAMIGKLQRKVQKSINNVTLGLQSNPDIPDDFIKIPGVSFALSFVPPESQNHETLKTEFHDWVLINGFRDASESISSFLEETYAVLALWQLIDRQNANNHLLGDDWNELVIQGAKRFHRLGLPDKIEYLKAQNLEIENDLISNILSINIARNCLVHRDGFVGGKDFNSKESLNVSWKRMSLILMDESGEKEIQIPHQVEKESTLAIKNTSSTKKFELGEKITFTTQEFSDICWCLYLFGLDITQKIEKFGVKRGHLSEKNI